MARIGALQQNTLGHVSLDLRVGPIRAPTLMHVMEGNTSYPIILGHPWLKVYRAMSSTYQQCVKAIWGNKQVVIKATKVPFDKAEFILPKQLHIKSTNLKVRIEFFLSILLLCK